VSYGLQRWGTIWSWLLLAGKDEKMSTLCDEQKPLKGLLLENGLLGREEVGKSRFRCQRRSRSSLASYTVALIYMYRYVASCIAAQSLGLQNGAASTITASYYIAVRLPRHLTPQHLSGPTSSTSSGVKSPFLNHRGRSVSQSRSRIETRQKSDLVA
jgi:hypothetical protein